MHHQIAYAPPAWAENFMCRPSSRMALARLPTPIQKWNPPGCEGAEVWIKRDDLTGCALSGNKVRKLDFLLADARERQCDVVLTCGGIQSNHARATALAARQLGMDSILFLRSHDGRGSPETSGNLFLGRMAGAELRFITPEAYAERNSIMGEAAAALEAGGRRPYIIPEGGSNGLGCWGYLEAAREITAQAHAQGLDLDHVVMACGSGGTAAGLSLGLHHEAAGCRVHAVNVAHDAAYFYRQVNGIYRELGVRSEAEDLLNMIDGYVGRGYGLTSPEETARLEAVAKATGVLLDPVYTGKAYRGLVTELAQPGSAFRNSRILFVHTGGLFGWYAMLQALEAESP